MTAPNMATITAALERSLQHCSLSSGGPPANPPRPPLPPPTANHPPEEETLSSLELNSHLTLPYEWEQCLDLKTGEIYYINWRNGVKVKEDPREIEPFEGGYYSEDDSSSQSDDSSASSSPRAGCRSFDHKGHVLVVAGCRSCLMYFMLPKTVFECPKCGGSSILHFDREEAPYL